MPLTGKRIDTQKLYVKEPVEDVCKKIEDSIQENVIILGGGRGTGKTTVLKELENRGIDKPEKFINVNFDSVALRTLDQDPKKGREIERLHYELTLCNSILHFIKTHYMTSYFSSFTEFAKTVEQATESFTTFIRNSPYHPVPLEGAFKAKDITPRLLSLMKECLSPDCSLSLGIDRFDWNDNKSHDVQETISTFFPLFDRVVLSVDDSQIVSSHGEKLDREKYSYVEVNYGKDPKIVKSILVKYIEHVLKGGLRCGKEELSILDIAIPRLIEVTNGRISLIIDIIKRFYSWQRFNIGTSLDKLLDISIKDVMNFEESMGKVRAPSKFHL